MSVRSEALRPPRPVRGLGQGSAYRVPRSPAPTDLPLDVNEGPQPEGLEWALGGDLDCVRRYPDASGLEARLAADLGVEPERVLLTAGADDSLLRICLTLLEPGRELILPVPTFEMIPRYATLAGATIRDVPWMGDRYPVEDVLEAVTPATAMIAVVSPNNPTGAVATPADLRRLSEAAPHAWILVDEAYAEFADEPLTELAFALPNTVIVRSLSKSWSLAGLRVGYVTGALETVNWLRRAGNPFPVSGPSLAIAQRGLDRTEEMAATLQRVRRERGELAELLNDLGLVAQDSQANFVLARGSTRLADEPLWLRDALAARGIAIRAFPQKPRLENAVRITCPGGEPGYERLEQALRLIRRPRGLRVEVRLAQGLDLMSWPTTTFLDSQTAPEGCWFLFDARDPRRQELLAAARSRGDLPFALSAGSELAAGEIEELRRQGLARVVTDLGSLAELLP